MQKLMPKAVQQNSPHLVGLQWFGKNANCQKQASEARIREAATRK